MFIGRGEELVLLQGYYDSQKSELVVLTGRRRVGKSTLISHFITGKTCYKFEGLEKEDTQGQINYFKSFLYLYLKDPLLNHVVFTAWNDVLRYLTNHLPPSREKIIIVFDEFQWMASGQGGLVSLIKSYWDNEWKKRNIMLILCGSIASFMFQKVIRSKALYGRISCELQVKGLKPADAVKMFRGKRSLDEALSYLLVFGGVPKYLEEIKLNRSFAQNVNALCFSKTGIMLEEYQKIFYSHFKRHRLYEKIVLFLKDKMLSLNELSQALKKASSGGLLRYLKQLEDAEFIRSEISFDQPLNTKFKKYRLFDEFLLFYFSYMLPNLRTIRESPSKQIFEMVSQNNWEAWQGYAFERHCLKHAHAFARIMGFEKEVMSVAPYFGRNDQKFQIDLLFKRADKVITVCEIKYRNAPIGPEIIVEVQRKCDLLVLPRGYTLERALISVHGATKTVMDSGYFHHCVVWKEIL